MSEEQISQEELLYVVNDKVDALIELLIEKKILSEEDFTKKLEEMYDEEEEEETDDALDEENSWNPDCEYEEDEEVKKDDDYSDAFPDETEETPFD